MLTCFGSGLPVIVSLRAPRHSEGLYCARGLVRRLGAVQLHQHAVVDIGAERFLDGFQVSPMPIRCELDAVRQPAAKIVHQCQRIAGIAPADRPCRTSLESASSAVQVQTSPAPSGAPLAVATFFAFA